MVNNTGVIFQTLMLLANQKKNNISYSELYNLPPGIDGGGLCTICLCCELINKIFISSQMSKTLNVLVFMVVSQFHIPGQKIVQLINFQKVHHKLMYIFQFLIKIQMVFQNLSTLMIQII